MRSGLSIAGLMAITAVIALDLAALRSPSEWWPPLVFTLTPAVLLAATVVVGYRRGGRRAFWLGFAAFGWAYFIAAFGPWFRDQVGPRLLTTPLLEWSVRRVHRPPTAASAAEQVWSDQSQSYVSVNPNIAWWGRREGFLEVGHCTAALLAALVGGLIARLAFATSE
jgi:hypothetical protein